MSVTLTESGARVGRPRKYQDIESFQAAIDAYFDEQEQKGEPPTVTGIARVLGTNRQTLLNYEQFDDAPAFVDAIKDAKARVEARTVAILLKANSKVHPAGPIFVLKNNHGYRDIQEVQVDSRSVVMGVTVSLEQHRQELATIDAQIAALVNPQNQAQLCDAPTAGDTRIAQTFASDASLSPVPRND